MTRPICATSTPGYPCYACVLPTPSPGDTVTVTVVSCSSSQTPSRIPVWSNTDGCRLPPLKTSNTGATTVTEQQHTITVQPCGVCSATTIVTSVPGHTPGACYGCVSSSAPCPSALPPAPAGSSHPLNAPSHSDGSSSPVVTTVVNSEQPPAPTPTPSSVALPPAPAGPSNPPNAPSYSDDSSRTIVTTVVNSEQPPVPTLTLSTVALPSSSTREKSPAEEPTTPPLPAPSYGAPTSQPVGPSYPSASGGSPPAASCPAGGADCGPAPETTLSSTTTETPLPPGPATSPTYVTAGATHLAGSWSSAGLLLLLSWLLVAV